MDVLRLIDDLRESPDYAGQMAFIHVTEPQGARLASPFMPLSARLTGALRKKGIDQLYSHQAEAVDRARAGENLIVVTGAASGKSLCYQLSLLESHETDGGATSLLLFPTKALSQDQHRAFRSIADSAGMMELATGIFDGDTPATLRRRLRDDARAVFTNPDMLHAAMLPQHARWSRFLSRLRFLVIDEIHAYNGIFGTNVGCLLRRLDRVCRHYGADPRIIACSATIGNPKEMAEALTGKRFTVIDDDGSPRGRRAVVFWNPPKVRGTFVRSRRSANVEAHDLMAELVRRGIPVIVFSKTKMTAEMIARYVSENLLESGSTAANRVIAYRGGYLASERRSIEKRLFEGELLGVSATTALELGIDVGGLDACIIVGYPGTLASFHQQAGRAGRQARDSLVILVAHDTLINQYIMNHPGYLFDRPIEMGVVEPDNPFVVMDHLRCAAHELPIERGEIGAFGADADVALGVLETNEKLRCIYDRWYHSASEIPQHEVGLRNTSDAQVVIEDADTGDVIGECSRYDAPPILHPGAIYFHQGNTYRVLDLDQRRNIARVKRVEVDYYTNPLGGTDVHHVDHLLREKPFHGGRACWGEVTSYFRTIGYEKIHFYSLDAISEHGVTLEQNTLETMAVWVIPPEELMVRIRDAGLDPFRGLKGIGYATRMMLPLYVACDTYSFSHTIGSSNSPWNAIFIYERVPHGMGFTERAYDRVHEIMPAVLDHLRGCDCEDGCPCCVGKPLRGNAAYYVERGEGSIPSRKAAWMILEEWLGNPAGVDETATPSESGVAAGDRPDRDACVDSRESRRSRLEQALRRRLERRREPQVVHPIDPVVALRYPDPERSETLRQPDVAVRSTRRSAFERDLRRRMDEKILASDSAAAESTIRSGADHPPDHRMRPSEEISSPLPTDPSGNQGAVQPSSTDQPPAGQPFSDPSAMERRTGDLPAADPRASDPPVNDSSNTGQPKNKPLSPETEGAYPPADTPGPIHLGDSLASRARKRVRRRST